MLAALSLSLQLQQTSFDLLDGVSIALAAHNPANTAQLVKFAHPVEYEIQILDGGKVIWSNAAPAPEPTIFPIHARKFVPGPSTIVVYIWNGVENDGDAPEAGDYTVRARLLGVTETPEATAKLHFAPPTPIVALDKLKTGDVVTIAGTLDATKGVLTDTSGSVTLGRRLTTATGTIAVRGYYLKRVNRTPVFFIQRWAPLQ
jgi:hypothetical protein